MSISTICVNCPNCGEHLEFASSIGAHFNWYGVGAVPLEVAQDLTHSSKSCKCGKEISIEIDDQYVRMLIVVLPVR